MSDLVNIEIVALADSVLLTHAAKATGLSITTMCRYIENGIWREGKEWEVGEDRQARMIVSGYHAWVKSGPPDAKQALAAAHRLEGQTSLYRHFDVAGVLLYVGISLSVIGRLSGHRNSSGWYSRIAKVTVEQFPTRAQADAAETVAIQTEKPLHNIAKARKS